MSDTKVTALTELTTPGATDVIPIVDNSGTATTKKIQYSNLKPTKIFTIPFVIVDTNGQQTESTSYDNGGYWKISFDSTLFPNATSIKFQVLLQQDNAGTYMTYCQLLKGDTVVTGSEVSADLGQYGTSVQTSGDLTANMYNGASSYRIQLKAESGGKCNVQNATILVNMSV